MKLTAITMVSVDGVMQDSRATRTSRGGSSRRMGRAAVRQRANAFLNQSTSAPTRPVRPADLRDFPGSWE